MNKNIFNQKVKESSFLIAAHEDVKGGLTHTLRNFLLEKKPNKFKLAVKNKQSVAKGEIVFIDDSGEKVLAKRPGTVKIEADQVIVAVNEENSVVYKISPEFNLLVKDGDLVTKGDILTDGSFGAGNDAERRRVVR